MTSSRYFAALGRLEAERHRREVEAERLTAAKATYASRFEVARRRLVRVGFENVEVPA